jgi:hypothetical protein
MVSFAAPFPAWAVVALVLAAIALSWAAYARADGLAPARRLGLVSLRLLAFLLVILFLMQPVRVGHERQQTGAVVPVLVDVSRSMALPAGDGRSRIEAAAALLQSRLLPLLSDRFVVAPLAFGERLADADPRALEARDDASDLAAALAELGHRFDGRTIAGVVVLSDGGVTEPPPVAALVQPPVFTVGVGPATLVDDREVVSVTLGEPHISESVVELAVTVVDHGGTGNALDVRVLEDGRPIDARHVPAPLAGTPVRVVFRVSPRRDAPTVYTVEVAPGERELTLANNRQSILAPPAGAARRLLLVQGAPGFDHSFLKRSWEQDSGLLVDSIVRKGQNQDGEPTYYVQAGGERARALTGGFPATREALFAYDGVVLANLSLDDLTREQVERLTAFVGERGGGLLLLGARTFDARSVAGSPMEPLLPWHVSDRGSDVLRASLGTRSGPGVALTAEGQQHPVMRLVPEEAENLARWSAAPSLAAGAPVGGPRAGASVLAFAAGAGGVTRPLVAVQRYGRGRVLAFSGEAAFRWKMMLPSDDRLYDAFWRQAGRWVAAGAPGPLHVDVSAVAHGQRRGSVRLVDAAHQPIRDADVRVTVTGPDGLPQSVPGASPGASTGRYDFELPPGRGVFRVDAEARRGADVVGRGTAWALAGGVDREMADPRRHDAVLQRIAQASGGRVLRVEELGTLPSLLSDRLTATERRTERALWHNAWAFLALVGCLAAEWTLRRRWGLR